jgi:hypothetical protein
MMSGEIEARDFIHYSGATTDRFRSPERSAYGMKN